jgi:hypothetical protein
MKDTDERPARVSEKAKPRSTFKTRSSRFNPFPKTEWLVFLGLGLYLLAALFLVRDYGMNIDSQKNFREGEMNLNYLLTGHVDEFVLEWQMHGTYIFMAADLSKRLFHDALHLYDATAARHIILPFMTASFLVFLFYFVKRRWDALHGLAAVGTLLTFPYFWGHSFNNLKDTPLLIFFSLSIMSFVEWTVTRSIRYLYGFFVLWSCALSVKAYALYIPVMLALWMLVKPKDRESKRGISRRGLVLHTIAGLSITLVMVLALYAPSFWGVDDKLSFLRAWHDHARHITWAHSTPFNLGSFVQVFFRTPLLVLIFALIGLLEAIKGCRRFPLYSLLLIWLLVPLAIPCFPRTLIYHNGMRLFMVFLVPFCLLSSVGIARSIGFLAKRMTANVKMLSTAVVSLTVGVSLWGVISTHPYQTTFFNALAGGLGGAQKKNIADSWDYWLNSYREAERWINRFGAADARVVGLYMSGTPPFFNTDLVGDAIERPDLKLFHFPAVPASGGHIAIPDNSYMIFVPFDYLRMSRLAMEQSGQFQKVYTISRQGGEVCTIYYKPRSS